MYRIGYAVFMLEELRQQFPTHHIQLMYDIACTLESTCRFAEKVYVCDKYIYSAHFIPNNLQANDRSDFADFFELAIPIFHAYGHKMECQVHYHK